MRLSRIAAGCLLFLALLAGSSASAETTNDRAALVAEAGFCELEPIAFSFQGVGEPLSYESSRARLFYSFHPADRYAAWKPLFVFFNGGPGCATCTGLLSLDTGPFTLNRESTGGDPVRRNPHSWTSLGNLLHIDAPNTGFSYNLAENVSDPKARAAEFGVRNFNPFLDAAQVLRVVLRFLDAHPQLRGNPVVLVGESYGGERATVMLNLLLLHEKYGDGSKVYRDEALAVEIRRHLEAVFPNEPVRPFPPATVARQFGHQVLIQPLLAGFRQDDVSGELLEQPESPVYKVAEETGKTFTPCSDLPTPEERESCDPFEHALDFVDGAGRDVYQYRKPANWFMELEEFAETGLLHVRVLSRTLGQSAPSVSGLPSAARAGAYRYKTNRSDDLETLRSSPDFDRLPVVARMRVRHELERTVAGGGKSAPQGGAGGTDETSAAGRTLDQALGTLNAWDDYIVVCNNGSFNVFYSNEAVKAGYRVSPYSGVFGSMFLQNLALTKTFITNAALDLVIYSPAIPLALKSYKGIVSDVTEGDGIMLVSYRPGSLEDISTPASRVIFHPLYERAGHGVSASQPGELLRDVRDWMLSNTGEGAVE